MQSRRPPLSRIKYDLLLLTLLALAARLGFLIAGLMSQDLSDISMLAADSTVYAQIAEFMRTGGGPGREFSCMRGPGYPALLAGFQIFFGNGPVAPVTLNLILGSISPAVIYLLARELLDRRHVAVLAGLIVALSPTGMSMSTSVLTDQPFYTLHAFSILLFLKGLKYDRARWYIGAGLTAAAATYVRAVGQFWPIVFLVLALLLVPRNLLNRKSAIGRSLWTPAIMVAAILIWSTHNYIQHDLFMFSTDGVRSALSTTMASAIANHTEGKDIHAVRDELGREIYAWPDGQMPPVAVRAQRIRAMLLTFVQEHPGWFLQSYAASIKMNVRGPNSFARVQVPSLSRFWDLTGRVSHDSLNPLLFWSTLFGLYLLAKHREWTAFLILGAIYGYFTLLLGFVLWVGSRIHYPAEMAWSILLAYVLVSFAEWLLPRIHAYRVERQRAAS